MVNSKELTIGAWVRSGQDVARITALAKVENNIYVEGNVFDGNYDVEDDGIQLILSGLTPIPVTSELLERNGWKKVPLEQNTYVHPILGEKNKIIFQNGPIFHGFKVPYVHQLQNILAIMNDNISIELQTFRHIQSSLKSGNYGNTE